MEKENFSKYLENYIENLRNINDKPKARFFLDGIKNTLGETALAYPDTFGIIDKDYLLNSLEDYFSNSPPPSKQAAGDYRRTILGLCETVCNDYGIQNNFLLSVPEKNDFDNKSRDMIALLREPESRECMSLDEFEVLYESIRDFFNTNNLDDEIEKSIIIENNRTNHYGRLVSAIAVELVNKYGLSNDTIPNLKISDLHLQDQILEANSFKLTIDETLARHFVLYLRYRQLVLEEAAIQTNFLFIKKNGSPYLNINNRPESGQLFLLMKSAIGHTTTSKLRYKTIIELVSKGANIYLLSQLTNVTTGRITELCAGNPSEFENIFKGNHRYNSIRPKPRIKGQMQCPFCGNSKDACSENWILIQVSGNDKKYLACRECRGLDGKYRY